MADSSNTCRSIWLSVHSRLQQDFTGARFAPHCSACVSPVSAADRCADINQFGTVNPVYDGPHLLNNAVGGIAGGIGVSANDPSNPILSGTKLGYIREHVFGFEASLPKNLTFSARYIDRRQPRIVEDAAVVSVEQFNEGLFGQAYFLGNVSAAFDRVINPIPHTYTPGGAKPAACRDAGGAFPFDIPAVHDANGNVIGAVCFDPNPNAGNFGSDGIPDGFPDPVHRYKAVELELNKRFSDNWHSCPTGASRPSRATTKVTCVMTTARQTRALAGCLTSSLVNSICWRSICGRSSKHGPPSRDQRLW